MMVASVLVLNGRSVKVVRSGKSKVLVERDADMDR